MRHVLWQCLTVFACVQPINARTWYVTPGGTGQAPTIQAAVDSCADGDEVVLAPGTYTWTSEGASGTTSMVTIRKSITLRGEAGAESTILDAEGNSARVIGSFEPAVVTITGLTATGGHPPIAEPGGGILVSPGSTLEHCIIRNNRTESLGGGGGVSSHRATVADCQILNNRSGSDASGGGVSVGRGILIRCLVQGNASSGDPGGYGGGVSAFESEIIDCRIEGNRAHGPFGGAGGGLYASGETGVTISRCTFVGNSAESELSSARGGAIATVGLDPVSISECVFFGNWATNSLSGTIYSSHANVQISYCTLVGNSSGITHGTVRNSIIAASYEDRPCAGNMTFSCTVLWANAIGGNVICGVDGGGNFAADPQFCAVDPVGSRNVFLQSDSPCLNAPGCGRIGAAPVGCEAVSIKRLPWSDVKSIYRR